MSTPDSPYPPGQQGPSGQGGYQQGQYQQGGYQPPQYQPGGQQGQYPQGPYQQGPYQQPQYEQPQYQQPQYQQGQYQQGQYGYGQNPQGGYQQGGGYQPGGPYGPMPQGPYLQPGYGVAFEPGSYLGGGGVGFGAAIKLAFQNAFMYQGRASRSAYWWFALFSFIIGIGDFVVRIASGNGGAGVGVALITALVSLAMFIVSLPLLVRRLHDTDRSGGWVFIGLIPIVGAITLFVFTLLDGTPGPNRFG
jgi:uncharacterized membrane protein YhaH (DUF805 family)